MQRIRGMPDTNIVSTIVFIIVLGYGAKAVATDLESVMNWLETHSSAPTDGLAPGSYGVEHLDDLSRYIPPGYVDEFNFSELSMEIESTESYLPPMIYQDVSRKFSGVASIASDGALKGHTAGQPFTTDQILRSGSSRESGFMVAWNRVNRWQYHGAANENILTFIKADSEGKPGKKLDNMHGGGHVFRHVGVFYHRVYFSNLVTDPQTNHQLDTEGGGELLYKEFVEMTSPFDLAGMKFVIERTVDPYIEDQVNSYLPTERRVRRLSAKERADSWIGSEMTLDDFEGFSGLVLDNEWRYLGRKVVLRIPNSKNEISQYHGRLSTIPLDRWQLRKCFVVEAKPLWEGHPFGRRILFVDEETYSIAMSLIFDRSDRLFKVVSIVYGRGDGNGKNELSDTVPNFRTTIAMNLRENIASFGGVTGATGYPRLKPSAVRKLFSVSSLTSGR